VALAWTMVEPVATPVSAKVALVAFAAKVTVGGTVATLVLSDLRLTVRPFVPAAGDKFNVTCCGVVPVTDMVDCAKLSVGVGGAVTVTAMVLPEVKLAAEALMVADPAATPVTCGCVVGTRAPCGMMMLAGTVAIVLSVLDRVTVTGPDVEAVDKVTANGCD